VAETYEKLHKTQPDNVCLRSFDFYRRPSSEDACSIFLPLLAMMVTWHGNPVWVPGLKIDPLRLLAGCRKRQLNQAPLKLRGLIWLLMMDWSERGNILKSGPSWEPFRKNSALCSWQEYQSWCKERRNPQAPNGRIWGNRQKHHITVRDLLRFSTSSQRFS